MKKTIYSIMIFMCMFSSCHAGGLLDLFFPPQIPSFGSPQIKKIVDPIRVYDAKNHKITLKYIYRTDNNFTFSYIVDIKNKIDECKIFISLLDNDNFQISERFFVANIANDFSGSLKGNFTIYLPGETQISGAELIFAEIEKVMKSVDMDIHLRG